MSRSLPALAVLAGILLLLNPLLLHAQQTTAEAVKSLPLRTSVEGLVSARSLAGAVMLVADREKIIATETVGFSDLAQARPMPSNALFWIASMTKTLTAAAFMMLVDEGKIGLDDPVEKYLPEFKGQMVIAEKDGDHMLLKKPAHPITLREVLCHTSGMAFKAPFEDPALDLLGLAPTVKGYAAAPLLFEPGTQYLYSNEGINTAGRVMEVVSGQPFEEFLDQHLLKPLGMIDTTFWPSAEQMGRLAKSYRGTKDKNGLEEADIWALHTPYEDRHRAIMPGGGLFSTAQDVARFGQLLLNGGMAGDKRLLSEGAVKEITTRQTAPQLPTAYGLGCEIRQDSFGHGGAYATNYGVYPKEGLVLVYLIQHAGWRDEEGKKGWGMFTRKALETFAK